MSTQELIISIVFAAVPIGTLAFLIMQQTKRLSFTVDKLPAWGKRSAIAVISVILTAVFAWAKVPEVCIEGVDCLTKLSEGNVTLILEAALGAIVAFVIHKKK